MPTLNLLQPAFLCSLDLNKLTHTEKKENGYITHDYNKNQSREEKSISFHNGTPKLWSHLGSLMLSEMLSRIYKIHISTSKSKFFQSFSNLKPKALIPYCTMTKVTDGVQTRLNKNVK